MRPNDIVCGLALLTHGPLDVGLTLSHWHLEANPVVVELGPAAWVLVKLLAVLAYTWIYMMTREAPGATGALLRTVDAVLAVVGTAVVASNVVVVLG